ncbi:Hypothetical predicted protein [Pelobates cultripes]|uniref:Ubiquitin-like protease family profile domain-containing protein n=1 Tax=Pelobates cultripes TaxID=61616 RepID=A0AAD1TQG5_PELCU|nr:Hypothetical predicted protein [Pelobates cultripes]
MEKINETTKENIEKSQEKQKKTYAKKVLKKNKDVMYSVGDEVLLYNMRKRGRKGGRIEPDFSGPYILKELCGKVVKLENSCGVTIKKKISIDHIKPYRRSEENKAHSHKGDIELPKEIGTCVSSIPPRTSVICFATPEKESSASLIVMQSIEDRVKSLWEAEDDGSVEAVVGPYKLYVSSFRTLHGNNWLVDEVIDAFIHHLIVKHQEPVRQFDAVLSSVLFYGAIENLGKVVIMSKKVVVLMDPMANENRYVSKVQHNLHIFLRMYKPDEQPDQWKTWIMYHNNQQDSTSCGVLILMFAKEFLRTRTISEVKTSPEYIRDARLEIACALLQYKDAV